MGKETVDGRDLQPTHAPKGPNRWPDGPFLPQWALSPGRCPGLGEPRAFGPKTYAVELKATNTLQLLLLSLSLLTSPTAAGIIIGGSSGPVGCLDREVNELAGYSAAA